MSAPEQNVDTEEVPKFDALRPHLGGVAPGVVKWIDKLQRWCEAAVRAQERLGKQIKDRDDQIHDLQREATDQRDWEDFMRRVGDRIADTERGIYTLDETADWLRRETR